MSGVILLVSLLMIINLYFPAHHCVTEDLSPPRSNHHLMSVASPGSHLTQLIVFKNWTQDTVWHTEGGEGNIFSSSTRGTQKGNKLKGSGKLLKWKLFNFLQLAQGATSLAAGPSKQLQQCELHFVTELQCLVTRLVTVVTCHAVSRDASCCLPSHRSLFSYLSVWGSETPSYKFASGH